MRPVLNGSSMLLLAMLAWSNASAVQINLSNITFIADEMANGTIIVVTTGTSAGECTVSGSSISCVDGSHSATGDKTLGCGAHAGQGFCISLKVNQYEPVYSTQATKVDLQCGTGAKAGVIYTLEDGDGTGEIEPTRDSSGDITGGHATKPAPGGGATTCAEFDCTVGCKGTANRGCGCSVKK